jgi:hypothetical protein
MPQAVLHRLVDVLKRQGPNLCDNFLLHCINSFTCFFAVHCPCDGVLLTGNNGC